MTVQHTQQHREQGLHGLHKVTEFKQVVDKDHVGHLREGDECYHHHDAEGSERLQDSHKRYSKSQDSLVKSQQFGDLKGGSKEDEGNYITVELKVKSVN